MGLGSGESQVYTGVSPISIPTADDLNPALP